MGGLVDRQLVSQAQLRRQTLQGCACGRTTAAASRRVQTQPSASRAARTRARASTPKKRRSAARVSLRPKPSVPSVR